jgi:selenocysteine lyase/cysteine desulfurase
MLGGYEAGDDAACSIAEAYDAVGQVIGTRARNIAMVGNATEAFALALSAFDFAAGDVVLTTRNDYISNQLAFLSLEQRLGVEFVRAEDLTEGGVDPDSVRKLIAERRPKLVSVTWIPTNSGLVQPVQAIGEICAEAEVPYLVDACQAVGQMPIDVESLHCDFLSATARKFLRGPRGIGFLYVSDRVLATDMHPLYVDMRGANWTEANEFELFDGARRFENWEFPYALVLGFGEAARYALAVGLENAQVRAWELARYCREKLDRADLRVLDRGETQCAIVTVEVVGRDAGEVVRDLREWGINTSMTARDFAVLDMDDKHATTAVRISPHYYNTREEIDMCVRSI